jgi:hypothetical protein
MTLEPTIAEKKRHEQIMVLERRELIQAKIGLQIKSAILICEIS